MRVPRSLAAIIRALLAPPPIAAKAIDVAEARALFLDGFDSLDIARALELHESRVLQLLELGRRPVLAARSA